ncbi:CD209 antigen-like protein E [Melanotaenia boesemani]|uniref:CD209 antigen-like protein E n=1 Tax=Melanotaenia boesemani TaxID=1250792 RepID=UPI001C055281|nr:CD209 antigen-like protein E [Melanotaenia boesemani]
MVRIGSKSLPTYTLVIMCLGLLNTVLLLTAVVLGIYCAKTSEEPGNFHVTQQMIISEVKRLQIKKNEAVIAQEEAQQALEEERRSYQQVLVNLASNKTLSDTLQKQIETQIAERTNLRTEKANLEESCGRCQPAWFLGNTSCYFYAKHTSYPRKNWTESSEDCVRRGGYLAIIDTWEEQANVFEHIPRVPWSSRFWEYGGVWIGLNDIQTEGTWVWVDNTTLRGEGFWHPGDPNNYGVSGENCVIISSANIHNNGRFSWFDANCKVEREWLCEKKIS